MSQTPSAPKSSPKSDDHNRSQATDCVLCEPRFQIICHGHYHKQAVLRSKLQAKQRKASAKCLSGTNFKYSTKMLRSLTALRTWVVAPDVKMTYKTLDLRKSKLDKIPENTVLIDPLEAIRLDSNILLEDISLLGQVKNLRVAVLKHCDIKKLSQTGFEGSTLLALELNSNYNLSDFSDIKLLTRLQYLNIGSCNIFTIPTETLYLRRLRVLVLDDNPLQQPVLDFSSLTRLQVLLMKNCNLSEIPQHVLLLKDLMFLSVEQNRITRIASTLVQLPKLQVLSIYGNSNVQISEKVTKCPELKRINVDLNFPSKAVSLRMNKLIKIWKDTPCAWWKQL